MKRVLWGAALAAAACMFFACGEGSIDGFSGDDDMALLNYGQFNPDGMKGLVNTAMAQCEEDPKCKEAMENAKDAPAPADTAAGSSSATDSSGTSASSSSAAPGSSTASISSSSTTPASSATATSSTSSSSSAPRKEVVATKFVGTCSATSVVKGNSTKWSLNLINICSMEINCSLAPESYEWTFEGGDPETSTDAEPSVVYTEAKQYTAKVRLKNGDVNTTITCTPVTITGPEITGCTCGEPTYDPSNDLKDANSVKANWTVSGCKSVDGQGVEETEFDYTWSGTGVTGSTKTGTGTYTELGIYTASVEVSKYGKTKKIECPKASIYKDGWNFKCSDSNLKKNLTITERTCNGSKCYETEDSGDLFPNDCVKVSKTKTGTFVFGSWWCAGGPFTAHIRDCSGNEQIVEHDCSGWLQIPTITEQCDLYFYVTGVEKYTSKYGVW